jgi:hypothetical protein
MTVLFANDMNMFVPPPFPPTNRVTENKEKNENALKHKM